jgi:hypothetical protein
VIFGSRRIDSVLPDPDSEGRYVVRNCDALFSTEVASKSILPPRLGALLSRANGTPLTLVTQATSSTIKV